MLSATAVAASLAADAPPGARVRAALLNALIILVPIGTGLYAAQREAHRAFGRLLIAAGLVWSTAAFAQADASVPYSIGRIGGWLVSLLLVWLVLAHPTGELRDRLDRGLVAVALAILFLLYLPTALLVDAYPTQTPWSACRLDCPANAFMLVDQEPAFIDAWLAPIRETLLVAVFLGVLVALAARTRRATYLQRRMVAPVLLAAAILIGFLVAFVAVRRSAPGAPVVDTLGWLFALCVPGVALGFLVGLVRWRLYVARALQQLTVAMRREMGPQELGATLAQALADPSLRIAFNRAGGWIDPTGKPVARPKPGTGQALTELRDDEGVIATLVHDGALADDEEFVAAVAACALSALEHQRLAAAVSAAFHELEESRARLVADADRERRRIERDLHDGAQQKLVALRVDLELARDQLATGGQASSVALQALGAEVDEIIDEIRSFARGVYPSLLADRGLHDALRAAARSAPLPARVDAAKIARYPQEIETAVYFVCLEALQNASKYAHPAQGVWISLRADRELTFEVRDDGPGFDEATARAGSGLTNMRDRVAAVGGTLAVHSAPGRGTRVIGKVPLN